MNTKTLTKHQKHSDFDSVTYRDTPSLRELARQAGVSPAYLSQVKNGVRPASVKLLSNPDVARWLDTNDESTHLTAITSRLRYHFATRAKASESYEDSITNDKSTVNDWF
jgi:transcriptional regulator with XRE-family HTH domain